jgi:tetratricopeptide (TPR) repeat protein
MSHLEEWEILDLLTALVDKSLVVYEEDEHGVGWYRLLQTTQQYAHERLMEVEKNESQTLRQQHRDWYVALSEEAFPHKGVHSDATEIREWLERLETEHDNQRAALATCQAGMEGGVEAGLRLCVGASEFWVRRGYWTEGRERCAAALAQAGTEGRTKERGMVLIKAGLMAMYQGEPIAARFLFEESLSIHRGIGEPVGLSLHFLRIIAQKLGDDATMRSISEELRALNPHRKRTGVTALHEGDDALAQGDYDSARALYEESLAMHRNDGDLWYMSAPIRHLGHVARHQGDYAAARSLYEESTAILLQFGVPMVIAENLGWQGIVISFQGDYAAAHSLLLEEKLGICRESGHASGIAHSLEGFAVLAAQQSQPERAARLWGAAEALREAIFDPMCQFERAEYERNVATARAALGEEAFAAAWAEGRKMTMEEAVEYALET